MDPLAFKSKSLTFLSYTVSPIILLLLCSPIRNRKGRRKSRIHSNIFQVVWTAENKSSEYDPAPRKNILDINRAKAVFKAFLNGLAFVKPEDIFLLSVHLQKWNKVIFLSQYLREMLLNDPFLFFARKKCGFFTTSWLWIGTTIPVSRQFALPTIISVIQALTCHLIPTFIEGEMKRTTTIRCS